MHVTVIGTGYVGLVSGACFADRGHVVTCVDVDAEKVARLHRGEMPIHEPGLREVVERAAKAGRLSFTTSYAEAIPHAEIVVLAVGTPSAADGAADLQYVFAALDEALRVATGPLLFVTKSTVPVGTATRIEAHVAGATFPHDVASNPELLRESRAIEDFFSPSRILFGARRPEVFEKLHALYAPWDCPKLEMTPESAELTKYAANVFLATKISFINEVAQLAEATGADIQDIARGIGLDPRIGTAFLHAGLGWGGSCFPKDVSAFLQMARTAGVDATISEAAVAQNQRMGGRVAERVLQALEGGAGKTVAVLGLSFKGGTDDTRQSPALKLIRRLIEGGVRVRSFDPAAVLFGEDRVIPMERCSDPYDAAHTADAVVIATEWEEFCTLDLARLKAAMRGDVFVDGRNVFDPTHVRVAGFRYFGVGRV